MDNMKQDNEPSLGEFMKISLEGFSWAENICQRVENICTENNMIQNPGKYANAVGEHFKKVIDTIVNDLCDHADDVLELFSELTLGHDSLVKTSGKNGAELDGDLLNENPSTSIFVEETALMENSSLEHDSVPNVLDNLRSRSRKSISDGKIFATAKLDEEFLSTVDSYSENGANTMIHERSPVEIEEHISLEKYASIRFEQEVHSVEDFSQVKLPSEPHNCSTDDFCDVNAFDVNLTRSLSLTEANSSLAHNSIATDRISPFYSICILDLPYQDSSCLLELNGSEVIRGLGHEETEITTQHEKLNKSSSEELVNSSMFSLKNEDLDEFEDVKLEDDFEEIKAENDWDDIVKSEIALISSMVEKRESSKKKLKKFLSSRWRPSINRNLETHEVDLHLKTSLDSDWELL